MLRPLLFPVVSWSNSIRVNHRYRIEKLILWAGFIFGTAPNLLEIAPEVKNQKKGSVLQQDG